jgi:PTS system ascorbate-specific IIA component
MAVGVLLVTHEGLGQPLLAVVSRLIRPLPLPLRVLEVPFDGDEQALLLAGSARLRELDQGDGVLILTDLYGASPSNLAARLTSLGSAARRVAGLNLPMLLRVLNYPERDLAELALIAASGARNGIITDHA